MINNSTARAVILDARGQMLVVRRSSTDPYHAGSWDVPGGQVEPGEEFSSAAVRETREEVGLQLVDPLLIFATSDIRDGVSKTWLFYTARLQAGDPIVLGDEHDAYTWIMPEDLGDYTDYDVLLRFRNYIVKHQLLVGLS